MSEFQDESKSPFEYEALGKFDTAQQDLAFNSEITSPFATETPLSGNQMQAELEDEYAPFQDLESDEDRSLDKLETSEQDFLYIDQVTSPFANEALLLYNQMQEEAEHDYAPFQDFETGEDERYLEYQEIYYNSGEYFYEEQVLNELDAYDPQDFIDEASFENMNNEFHSEDSLAYEYEAYDPENDYLNEADAYHPNNMLEMGDEFVYEDKFVQYDDYFNDEDFASFDPYSYEYEAEQSELSDRWIIPQSVRNAGDLQMVIYHDAPRMDPNKCSGRLTEGARVLCHYLGETFPGIKKIGGYNCRSNSARPHMMSIHGTGRALDTMIPTTIAGKADSRVGDPIANWLVTNASALGIQYLIWNRMRWSGSRRSNKFARYTGPNPHVDHIHVELNLNGAQRKTPWFANRPVPTGGHGRCYDNPTHININRASSKNRRLRKQIGWDAHRDAIARLLGFSNITPTEEAFARAVADWQRKNGLSVDGIIGSNTWKMMREKIQGSTNAAGHSSSQIDLKRAVQLNRKYQKELGWDNHEFAIQRLLGFTNMTPTEEAFAEAVAEWQRKNGLSVDGVIGRDTWAQIRPLLSTNSETELKEQGNFIFELEDEELEWESEAKSSVTFPSGESLIIVSGNEGTGKEYYDPNRSSNPLLNTSGPERSKRLSKNFTVDEFAKSGGKRFERARIDPKLIQCLQTLRDHIGKAININSGYRSFHHNTKVNGAKTSQHMSGRAADIRVSGMSGLGLAKVVIDVCGCNISIGVGETYIHLDVRPGPAKFWGYGSKKRKLEQSIEAYHRSKCPRSFGTSVLTRNGRTLNVNNIVRQNRRYSQRLGWTLDQVRRLLNLDKMPDDRTLIAAIADWQARNGLDADGVVGPRTWKVMQQAIRSIQQGSNLPSQSTHTLSSMPNRLGTLVYERNGQIVFRYPFTQEDLLWTARMISGEAGARDDLENRAVIAAMFNRYAIFTRKYYPTFHSFIRAYSTPLQPVFKNQRLTQQRMHDPGFVKTGGTFPGTNIPRGQMRKHLDLQQTSWRRLRPLARKIALEALTGQMPDTGIGLASEFASTWIIFGRIYGKKKRTVANWLEYTQNYKRSKGWRWIGQRPNLNQKRNAFFVRPEVANLPRNAVRVISPT